MIRTQQKIVQVAIAGNDENAKANCKDFLPVILPTIRNTLVFNDGKELLKTCENTQPDIGLFILDLVPIKGVATAKKIRSIPEYKTTPILFFSKEFIDLSVLLSIKVTFKDDEYMFFCKKDDSWNDFVSVIPKIMTVRS